MKGQTATATIALTENGTVPVIGQTATSRPSISENGTVPVIDQTATGKLSLTEVEQFHGVVDSGKAAHSVLQTLTRVHDARSMGTGRAVKTGPGYRGGV